MTHRANLRKRLTRQQDGKCFYCAQELVEQPQVRGHPTPRNAATLEHLIRRADGGGWEEENIVVACKVCNEFRDAIPVHVWKMVALDVVTLRMRRAKALRMVKPNKVARVLKIPKPKRDKFYKRYNLIFKGRFGIRRLVMAYFHRLEHKIFNTLPENAYE